MKKLMFAFAAGFSAVVMAAKLDGIAARVDSAIITVGDVMAEIRRNPEISGRMIASDESEMQALYRASLAIMRPLISGLRRISAITSPTVITAESTRAAMPSSFAAITTAERPAANANINFFIPKPSRILNH